ncbi:MAG: 2-dehydropantoate 2-reductase N-terminal domain-containing protein [Caldilineaceae bacterium]
MKTLIVGTGIIGTIYGWALAEADVDVTHFVRKGRRRTISGRRDTGPAGRAQGAR